MWDLLEKYRLGFTQIFVAILIVVSVEATILISYQGITGVSILELLASKFYSQKEEKLTKEINNLISSLNEERKKNSSLTSDNISLISNKKSMDEENYELVQENSDLSLEILRIKNEANDLRSENSRLLSVISTMEKDISDHDDGVTRIDTKKYKLIGTIKVVGRSNKKIEEEVFVFAQYVREDRSCIFFEGDEGCSLTYVGDVGFALIDDVSWKIRLDRIDPINESPDQAYATVSVYKEF